MKSLIHLLKYLKPYRIFAILGPFFMFVEVAMDLLQPMMLQLIIDEGIANDDSQYVIKMGAVMIGFAVIGLIGGLGCSYFSTHAAVNFATDVRKEVFRKIEYFSSRSRDSFGIGKLITVATNDVNTVQSAVLMTLKIMVRGPLLFIGSIIIVFFSAREFFSILLVVIPLLAITNWFIMKKAGQLFLKVQEAVDKVNTILQENLSAIPVVKAFGRETYEKEKFSKVNTHLTDVNIKAQKLIVTLMPLMLFFVNLGIVFALWLGVIKIDQGKTEIGVVLAFINYLNITLNALMSSSHALMGVTRAFPSADRIVNILETESELVTSGGETKLVNGEIEFRNVSFRYTDQGEYVLNNISFHITAGEKVGIIGSIGSGKTSLIKLIARLYDPSEGEILLDGVNIQSFPPEYVRSHIGFVPQKAHLFSGTIKENILFGHEEGTDEQVEEAAQHAQATFIDQLPEKYEHRVAHSGNNLSGGQKQRLSIARAFIRKPAILIFDDSTSAVDSITEKRILEAIYNEFSNTTTLMISAKISSIQHADKIIVMHEGKVSGIGTHEQLLKENEIYQQIYETQCGKGVYANA